MRRDTSRDAGRLRAHRGKYRSRSRATRHKTATRDTTGAATLQLLQVSLHYYVLMFPSFSPTLLGSWGGATPSLAPEVCSPP